jgi:uncharacterized membrane protein (DUF441 family)
MELIQLIVVVIVIGVLLWLVNTYIPMDSTVKQILNAVVIIALVVWLIVWLLGMVGLLHYRVGGLEVLRYAKRE